ncbi:MAG: hypothetical protein Q9M39_05645 [Sulfurovum sp.]|nr:hypothetical protein [Sulfurovum sp.]
MNFTGSNKTLILVHRAMDKVRVSSDVNVMLTPQFYTLKKQPLPVRYAYEAKRIAPSLFEGLLEEGKSYDYMVWKEEEDWVFLAYNLEMIAAFLKDKGFVLEHISKLFFAQQSADFFVSPLFLGSNEALLSFDDVIVVVPRVALGEDIGDSLVFDTRFTPKKGITLQDAYGSILTLSQTVMLSSIFGLMAIIFFIEGSRYSGNSKAIQVEMDEIVENYPSLSSKYTRESIVSKYKTLDRTERKKRETIKTLAGMIFKGVTLTSFEMNDEKFSAHFSSKDAEVFKKVKALAKKNNFKMLSAAKEHDLKIEGTL